MSYLDDLAKRLELKAQSETACPKFEIENCRVKTDLGGTKATQGSGFFRAPLPMKTCGTSKHTVIK
ncbi:hypothetical protein [Pedobacter sp. Leaf176]|uniref:hypothetical protein n=1 Tax=Pedobacter sp. Leaf176 TaxID=1736286 RepID=UPI0006FC0F16|nr:hypothetical protein [Pedobacter sp. Leaf176]KQR72353.1 hypothetical protein ASF92_03435 [Pedobacter sp. Leaf176]